MESRQRGEMKESNVINVTEEARELFTNVERPEGTVLRLDPVEQDENGQTQIGLVAGEPQGDDQVVQHDGQDLLHIAAPVSEALDGASIEKVETDEGVGFSINPPEGELQSES